MSHCCVKKQKPTLLYLRSDEPTFITKPGKYIVCNDVNQALTGANSGTLPEFPPPLGPGLFGTPAAVIHIQANDVILDLDGHVLTGNGKLTKPDSDFNLENDTNVAFTSGITVDNVNNIKIYNGTLRNFSTYGVYIIGSSNVTCKHLEIVDCGNITYPARLQVIPMSGAIGAILSFSQAVSRKAFSNIFVEHVIAKHCRGLIFTTFGACNTFNVQNCQLIDCRGCSNVSNYKLDSIIGPSPLDYTNSEQIEDGEVLRGLNSSALFDVGGIPQARNNNITWKNVTMERFRTGIQSFAAFTVVGGDDAEQNWFNAIDIVNITLNNSVVSRKDTSLYTGTFATANELRGITIEEGVQGAIIENCSVKNCEIKTVIPNATEKTNRCTAFNLFRSDNVIVKNCNAENIIGTSVRQPVGFGCDDRITGVAPSKNYVFEDCVVLGIKSVSGSNGGTSISPGPAFGFLFQATDGAEFDNISLTNCKVVGVEAGSYTQGIELPESAGFGLLPDTDYGTTGVFGNRINGLVVKDCLAQKIVNGHGFLLGENVSNACLVKNMAKQCDLSGFKDTSSNNNYYESNRTFNNGLSVGQGSGKDYDVSALSASGAVIEHTPPNVPPSSSNPIVNISSKSL